MKIKILKTNQNKSLVKEKAIEYLQELIGHDAKDLNIVIRFRKMSCSHLGKTKVKAFETKNQEIIINSILIESAMLHTLAHECTHVKQVYLGELAYKREVTTSRRGLRMKAIRVWKGKEVKRKAYYNRAWEIEARSMADKLTKTKRHTAPIRVHVTPKPKVDLGFGKLFENARIEKAIISTVMRVLEVNHNGMPNAKFYADVLGIVAKVDKADLLLARRVIFNMREHRIFEEYTIDGVVYVREVK